MPVFDGTIRLGDGDGLDSSFAVDGGRLVVTSREHEIGNWAVEDLSVKRQNGEFRIRVEGEELVVAVADPAGMSEALGIKEGKLRRDGKPKAKPGRASSPEEPVKAATWVPVEPKPAGPPPEQEPRRPSWWQRLPLRGKVAVVGAGALVVLGIVAPTVVALLLLFAGLATLFLAILAKDDGGMGIHPPSFFGTAPAIALGFVMVVVALAIIVTA